MPARLVFYGLSTGPGATAAAAGGPPKADVSRARRTVGQLLRSVASLRAHNRDIPVRVFLFGELEPRARRELEALSATIVAMGDHEAHLRGFCSPGMSELLARYPVLHNITCLPMLADEQARQILYVDADTHFFRDVEALSIGRRRWISTPARSPDRRGAPAVDRRRRSTRPRSPRSPRPRARAS